MTTPNRIRSGGLALRLVPALLVALVLGDAGAATISIVNNDGAGEGFNDPTPRSPVGDNPGTTLGEQRLYVFQHAASIWGGVLASGVEILVRAQFNPLTCTSSSAVLGSAGPVTIHRDFANVPFPGTWYHQALANKLAGADLSSPQPDISATFNSALDAGTCLGGLVWYYGIDGNEGVNVELLPVVLHEIGHGLGFSTTTSGTTGNFNSGYPHVYDRFLMDNILGLHWFEMTAPQRVASAISLDHLVWDGPRGSAEAADFLGQRPQLVVHSPGPIAGTYAVQPATFGAPITLGGLTGDLVLAEDALAPINDACDSLTNGAALAGKIVFVDRGICTFVLKALAVQGQGAIGMIVANNVASGLPGMGGTNPAVVIPCVGISQADGNMIKTSLAGGVNVTMNLNPTLKAGTDDSGRPLMYAPNPYQSGSSVSHWDVSLTPNALMEPAISGDLHNSIDIAHGHFVDIGWFSDSVAVTLQEFTAEGDIDGIRLRWRLADLREVGSITLERASAPEGPWSPTRTELGQDGRVTTALDTSAEPGRVYYYHLRVSDRNGEASILGQVSAQRPSESLRITLAAPKPNPAFRGTSVRFRIGRAEHVTLRISDVGGRAVRTLQDGAMPAGEHLHQWDGRDDRGAEVPAGVYFIRLQTTSGARTQRLTIVH